MSLGLEIFLFIDVFLGGVAVAVASSHARAHFRPIKEVPPATPASPASFNLSTEQRDQLLKEAERHFADIIRSSANKLDHSLADTAEQINNLTKKLATEVVSTELEHYHKDLIKLQAQAAEDLGQIRQSVAASQDDIKAKAKEELEAEKQKLISQIDSKLSDAVGSFLTEALGHNADLGSQEAYLIETLEAHKDELKKEVGG